MTTESAPSLLSQALEQEHRVIDGGIEAYLESVAAGAPDRARLEVALSGLRRHIYLEEEFLFPPLKAAGMLAPVFVMLREHGELWDAMAAAELLADAHDPAVVAAGRDLLARLDRHNSKEEPIIYPAADRTLNPAATAELAALIAGGALPTGWVCERAARAG